MGMLGINIAEEFGTPLPTQRTGGIITQTANEVIKEALSIPTPTALWSCMWYEGEVCCLFADSNLGKSILAVQIAESIAHTQPVIYYDFELSDKQFQLRYTDENGKAHKFPDGMYRATLDQEYLAEHGNVAIIEAIEATTYNIGAQVIIIDNLTWLANDSENGATAGQLMQQLVALKFRYKWSILVIAHTPKRPLYAPLTPDCLAGSKKLYNFFDSVFAIGKSAKDEAIRYVKQLKCRYGAFTHGGENVITAEIQKIDGCLQFVFGQCTDEREHLQEQTQQASEELRQNVLKLRANGLSLRMIADKCGLSKSKVERIVSQSVPQVSQNVPNVSVSQCGTGTERGVLC